MQISINFNYKSLFDGNSVDHLPYREKAQELFELIKDCQNLTGWAFFKLKWIAERLNVTKRYVQKIVRVLLDACLIQVRRREHNFYRINPLLEQPERKNSKTTPTTRPNKTTKERELHDKATSKIGGENPSSMPSIDETEARAIIEAYNHININKTIGSIEGATNEATNQTTEESREEPTNEGAKEGIEDENIAEMSAIAQEAANEVRKELRYNRPKGISDYLTRVKNKLVKWQIEVPGRMLTDTVVQFWRTW